MKGKIFAMMLVLLMVAVTAACSSDEQEMTGQELIDGVLTNIENQETYRWEMNTGFTMSGTVEGQYGELDYSMDSDGVIDLSDQEMQMNVTTIMSLRTDTETDETSEVEAYLMGETAYVRVVSQVVPSAWVKGDLPADYWEQDSVSQLVELWRGAEAEVLGTEEVKGVDCYKADISPDNDKLREYMSSQIEEEDLSVELSEDFIGNYSQQGWFAKETLHPMKAHQEFDMKVDIEGDEVTYHFIIDGIFYDWNESVSINLPAEAEDAEYIGPLDL